MGEVIEAPIITTLDIPAERVLRKAQEAKLTDVVVVGYDEDGELYFSSSYAGSPETIYLFERAKYELLKIEDDLAE